MDVRWWYAFYSMFQVKFNPLEGSVTPGKLDFGNFETLKYLRVGHIYRLEGWDGNPPPEYVPSNPSMRNYRRVIETWWDEYKEYFYVSRPESRTLEYGDLSVQHKFRQGPRDSKIDDFCFQFFFQNFKPIKKITVLTRSNGLWMR